MIAVFKKSIASVSAFAILSQSTFAVPIAMAQSGTSTQSSSAESSTGSIVVTPHAGSGSVSSSSVASSVSSIASSTGAISSSSVSSSVSSVSSNAESQTGSSISSATSSVSSVVSSASSQVVSSASSSIPVTLTGNTLLDVPENTHPTFAVGKSAEIQSGEELEERITVIVTDPTGQKKQVDVAVTEELGEYLLTLEPPSSFKPGKYHVEATIDETRGVTRRLQRFFRIAFTGETGDTILFEQDFTWGVVAFNPDRSIYVPEETGSFSLAVLDDQGRTLCDSNIVMTVTKPSGDIETFSTANQTIFTNPDCKDKEVTYVPDYSFQYLFEETGVYTFAMEATTGNGTRTLTQELEVKSERLIDVKRFSATRIYPLAEYEMKMKVTPEKTFIGSISEVVPHVLDIVDVDPAPQSVSTDEDAGRTTIVWGQKLWEAGVSYSFSYTYDAPDISPEFYLAGPLSAKGTLVRPLEEPVVTPEVETSSSSVSVSSVSSSASSDPELDNVTASGGVIPSDSETGSGAVNASSEAGTGSSISSIESSASSSVSSATSTGSVQSSSSVASSEEISSSEVSSESSSSSVSSESSSSSDSSVSSISSLPSDSSASSASSDSSTESVSLLQRFIGWILPHSIAQNAPIIDDTLDFTEPRQWQIASDAVGLSITGRLYSDGGTTKLGAGKTVAVSLNGGATAATDATDAGGEFVLTGLTMTGGTVVTLYIDGATEKGVTVTLGSGGTMTGMNIYQNRLITRSESGSIALTNTHLAVADNNADADISAIYSINSSVLNVKTGKALLVWNGDTFAPGSEVRVGSGVTVNGTLTMAANNMTLSGSWITGTNGRFTGTNTVTLRNTTTPNRTISSTGSHFNNLTVEGGLNSSTVRLTSRLSVSGALTLASPGGTWIFDANDQNVRVAGNFSATINSLKLGNGTWTLSGNFDTVSSVTVDPESSSVLMNGSGVSMTPTSSSPNFNRLTIDGYVSFSSNDLSIGTSLVINPSKKLSSLTNSISLADADSDLRIGANARMEGDFQGGGTSIQMNSGSSISQMDGAISNLIYMFGNHAGSGNTLVPGNYGEAFLLAVGSFSEIAPTELLSGTYTFGSILFGTTGAAGGVHFDNSRWDPNIRVINGLYGLNLTDIIAGGGTIRWTAGTGSITFTGGTDIPVFLEGKTVDSIIVTNTGAAVTLYSTGATKSLTVNAGDFRTNGNLFSVEGNMTLRSPGRYHVTNGGTLNLSGSLLNLGGQFRAGTGTLKLTGGNQTLTGATTFYNLTKTVTASRTLTLASGKTQTVSGALTLQGATNTPLLLRATHPQTAARINLTASGTQTIDHVDVMDQNATGQRINCFTTSEGCIDSGRNTNWNFGHVITGRVFTDAGVTSIGAGKTVSMSVNGAAAVDSAVTDAGGQFMLSGAYLTGGTIMSLYLDGNTEKGVTVVYSSGSAMTGVDIYQNNLIIRDEATKGSATLTPKTIDVADNNGDSDISAIFKVFRREGDGGWGSEDRALLTTKPDMGLVLWEHTAFTANDLTNIDTNVGSGVIIRGQLTFAGRFGLSGSLLIASGATISSFGGTMKFSRITTPYTINTNGVSIPSGVMIGSGVTSTLTLQSNLTLGGISSGSLIISTGTGHFNANGYDVTIPGNFNAYNTRLSLGDGTWTVGGDYNVASITNMSIGSSHVLLSGTGKTVIPSSFATSFNDLTINGYRTLSTNGLTVEGQMIINADKKLYSSEQSIQINSDLQIKSGARIAGDPGLAWGVQLQSGASISQMDGYFSAPTLYLFDQHAGPSDTIAPGNYRDAILILYGLNVSAHPTIELRPGQYIFDSLYYANGGLGMTFDNSRADAHLHFANENFGLDFANQTGESSLRWRKGTGSITINNTADTTINLLGESIDSLILNGTGYTTVISSTGSVHDLTINAGTLDQNDKDFNVLGNLTVRNGATFNANGNGTLTLSGHLLNYGQFLSGTGTVVLSGGDQTLSGSTSFWNLTKIVSAARTLLFPGTKTQTISGALILQGAANNRLRLRSSVDGVQANLKLVSSGTQTIDHLDVKDSNASGGQELVCNIYGEGCIDSGNNTNWFLVPPYVSGTVFTDEGSTKMGAGKTVSLSVNGGAIIDSTTTDAGGMYALSGAVMTGGTILTVYLDGNTEKGVTVTLGSGSSMTGVNIYQNRLIVRSDSGSTPITNTTLALADNSGDSDISSIYTINSNVLNVKSGKALTVWNGDTFTPGAAVNVGSGITINGALTMGTNNVTLSGSWITNPTGSFTASNLVTFDGTGNSRRFIKSDASSFSGVTITSASSAIWTLSGSAFNLSGSLTLSSGTWTFDNSRHDLDVRIRGDVTMANAATQLGDGTWTVSGNWNHGSVTTFSRNASTLVMNGSGKTLNGGTSSAKALNHFTVDGYVTVSATPFIFGNVIVRSGKKLSINTSQSFTIQNDDADLVVESGGRISGAGQLTIQSGASISVQNGVIDAASISIIGHHGGTGDRIAAATYHSPSVTFGTFGGLSTSVVEFGTGTVTFEGNVSFAALSPALTINNSSTNTNFVFKKNLSFSQIAALTWIKGSGTITFSGDAQQDINVLGRSLEDIIVNKGAGNVSLTNTIGTDGITVTSGTFEQRGFATTVSGSVAINGGTFKQGSGTLNLAGNFTNNAQFTTTNGTVALNGTNQTLSGSTTFYNLTKTVTSPATLTFASTKTQTVSGALTLQGGSLVNRLNIRSTTSGVRANLNLVSGATQTLNYLDVQDNNATGETLICREFGNGCSDSGNNVNWVISTPSVTGTVYTDEGQTSIGAGKTISMSVNGAAAVDSDVTNASGQFALSGAIMTGGTLVTVYLDGNSEKGVTVTLGSGSSMSNVNIYQNRLIARSDSGSVALTNAHLGIADNNGDSDISAIYSVNSNILNVKSGKALTVWSGDTFAPGAAVNVGSGITINGALSMGTNAVTLSGSWIAKQSGTFTGNNLVTFDGTGSTLGARVIRSNGSSFSGVTISGGGVYTVSGALTLTGNLSMPYGGGTLDNATYGNAISIGQGVTLANRRLDMGDGTWTVSGNWNSQNVTTFNANDSTLTMNGSGKTLVTAGVSGKALNDLTISGYVTVVTNSVYVNGTATVSDNAKLTVDSGNFFQLSSGGSDLVMAGSASRMSGAGQLTVQSGASISVQNGVIDIDTVNLVGMHFDSNDRIVAGTYHSPEFNVYSFGGTGQARIAFSPGTTQFNGTVAMTSVTPDLIVDNSVTNANLIFKQDLTLANGLSYLEWIKGTGTVTFSGTNDQSIDLLGRTVEDIVVNKASGIARLTGTGTTDSFTLTQGTFEQKQYQLTIPGDLTITSGQYAQGSGTLTLGGDLANDGMFSATTGSLLLNGTNQSISGTNSFYNLSKSVSSTQTLTFGSNDIQNISGSLILTGESGNRLNIRASVNGSQAKINLQNPGGSQTLEYLDVKDNNAIGAFLFCVIECVSSGNNTRWSFGAAGTGSINGVVWNDLDGDGVRESGENSGFSGSTLSLSGNTVTGATLAKNVVTDALGRYAFSGVVISDASGYDITLDTSAIPANYLRTRSTSSTGNVILTGSVINVDFGFVEAGTLTGTVFIDRNENGYKDPTETAVFSGVTVDITGTSMTGGTVAVRTLTNSSGSYSFDALPTSSGGYIVIVTPPTGYVTTSTSSRIVSYATGGQSFNENFGFVTQTSSEQSSSQGSSTAGTDGGSLRGDTIELQIRGVGAGDETLGEQPTPVTRPLTPEERAEQQARELLRNTRDRRLDRMKQISDILGLEEETPAFVSNVEARRQERLDRLALLESLKVKPLISLQPIPESPIRDFMAEVQSSLASKALDFTKEAFTTALNAIGGNAKALAQAAAGARDATVTALKNAGKASVAIAANLGSTITQNGKELIARAGEMRTAQLARNRAAQDMYAHVMKSALKPAYDTLDRTSIAAGTTLTAMLQRGGRIGQGTVNGLIGTKDAVVSLARLTQYRTSQVTTIAAENTKAAIAWTADTGAQTWETTKTFSKESVIGTIRYSLALQSNIDRQRSDTLSAVGTLAKRGFTATRDGAMIAMDQAGSFIDGIGSTTHGVRQKAVIAFANLLGVSDNIRTVTDQTGRVAAVPLEYKTKIRKEGEKEVIAAFHVNLLNVFGDPYARTPVVLFSTPKFAVTDGNGIVTFHGVEVGTHHIEIHAGNKVERREIVIQPPSELLPEEEQTSDVVLPVVQIVVSQPQHGAAPDDATFTPLVLLLIGMLAVGNIYTFYPLLEAVRRMKKRKKESE